MLTRPEIEANKERFKALLTSTDRPNIDQLLGWLETTDFYTAPASSNYHQNYAGGLCEHSLQVYRRLKQLCTAIGFEAKEDTLILVSLLHDITKVNCYVLSHRNVKNQFGQWEAVPYYMFQDQHGLGHSEASVIFAMKYIDLTDEEITAISSHMGFSDARFKGGSNCIGTMFGKYNLGVLLHCADLVSTYMN